MIRQVPFSAAAVVLTTLLLQYQTSPTLSSVVSSTRNRLPMSLSSVISDLEAEGVDRVSSATLLTSRSVSPSERTQIFQTLFEDYEEDVDNEATAFGKKLGDDDEHGVGVVVANPCAASTGSAAGVASTVLATHGTVIYIASDVDLEREEGLFEFLAPAVETLLSSREGEEVHRAGELIVIFLGDDAAAARKKFERAAVDMLATIVQNGSTRAEKMEDVFDTVEYLSSANIASSKQLLMDTLVKGEGQLLEPADAAGAVAVAVALGMIDPWEEFNKRRLSTVDLAAMRKIGPARDDALENVLATVAEFTNANDDDDSVSLVSNFGELATAAIRQSMENFDEAVGPLLLSKSQVARRRRGDLADEIVAALGDEYNKQLVELRVACFESFRKELSKLRVGPNLPQDMDKVVADAVKDFGDRAKNLLIKMPNSWSGANSSKINYRKELKEFCHERLQAAKLSGAYRPLPRKGVAVGLHWLLPKPFGNDYRQAATDIYRGDLVYSSKGKVTEVSPGEIEKGTGDWRNCVVPVPGATDMMYQAGTQ